MAWQWLRKSWWMLLFLAAVSAWYFTSMRHKELERQELVAREQALLNERELTLEEKEQLQLQIDSQEDPAWIEMVLMKNLGVVPEGKKKVYFEELSPEKEKDSSTAKGRQVSCRNQIDSSANSTLKGRDCVRSAVQE